MTGRAQPPLRRCGRSWRLAAAASLAALALAACVEGYPARPVEPVRTPQDRVQLLQELAHSGGTEVVSLALRTPCVLAVLWRGEGTREYEVPDLDTVADTDEASGDFVVFLQAGQQPPSPLFLATPGWAKMIMVRSHVNQLRADCHAWRTGATASPAPPIPGAQGIATAMIEEFRRLARAVGA